MRQLINQTDFEERLFMDAKWLERLAKSPGTSALYVHQAALPMLMESDSRGMKREMETGGYAWPLEQALSTHDGIFGRK